MLVKGGVEHDARVRKSARSLGEAGFEVIVFGATPGSSSTRRDCEGFELRLVPLPVPLPPKRFERRRRRLRRRITRLRARVHRIAKRRRELGNGDASMADGSLGRLLEQRQRRATRSLKRAKKHEKKVRYAAKAAVRLRSLRDPLDLAGFEACWWPAVRELQPDVVHLHKGWGFSVARRAATEGARWIYDARADPYKRRMSDPERDAMRAQVARHLRHADAVITGSAPLAELLTREFELSRAPVVVLDAPPLEAGPAPQPGLREQAGVDPEQPLLVYAGGMTRYRPLSVVVEAMTMLPAVHLALVVTADDYVREVLARADELGVSDRVHVVPKVPPEAVVAFIGEADVGVFPLTRYPQGDMSLPNKLFEYLHAGLPMVFSESPTMADFVRRHGLGEVAPVDDPAAWAEAIERSLAAPRYRDRASEWEALKAEWSWERQAKTLITVYREALGSAFPPVTRADVPAA
jgi:glycogen(starch) synthase